VAACDAPAGWNAAKGYTDPFAAEKPKFVITKANAADVKAKLAAAKTPATSPWANTSPA